MCPAATSTTTPSGPFRPSSMRVFKSEPSGFAVNTRPAPLSRKKSRADGVDLSAPALIGVAVFVFMHKSPCCVFQCCSKQRLETSLRATAEELRYDLVLLCSKLLDRAIARDLQDGVGNGLLQLRRNVRRAESLHPGLHRTHDVFHKMGNPARPSAEVPLEAWSHHAPSRPRSVAHRHVGIGDAQYALLNEVEHLLVERRLQPVGDMSGKRLEQTNWLFPNGRIKRHGLLDRLGRRFGSAHHFHQGNNVRRIERMSYHTPLGTLARGLDNIHSDSRRTRGHDRAWRRGIVHLCEQLRLEVRALGSVFLN